MSDIDIRKDGLYQGKPYGFDQAIEEATKIKKLVGEAATAERYQLASNIITARLEEDEIYTLANSTIPRLEPLVQSTPLFNELMGQYLSKHSSEITAQSPLSRDKFKNYITAELEVKFYRDWDIANHREKYADYQKDLSLKRTQLAKISSAFFDTFGGDENFLVSEDDVNSAIQLFDDENKQKLADVQARLQFLKDPDRVVIRDKLKTQELDLAKETGLNWISGVISRVKENELKRGVDNNHRWVAATRVDKWGRGFEAELCCTRCGMSFSKSPDNETRPDGELGYIAGLFSGGTGDIHTWNKLYRSKRNYGSGGDKTYHEGMYQLVAVTPYNLQTRQAGRDEIVQDQDGNLFSTQQMFVNGNTGRLGSQQVVLIPVKKEQVIEAIQETSGYFPDYKDVLVLRDVQPLELVPPPSHIRKKLEIKDISEVKLHLPLGLTLESAYQLVTNAREIKYRYNQKVDFQKLDNIGVPKELFEVISRYTKLILNQADPFLYKFQGKNSLFQGLDTDCSSAVLVALLLHPDFRGPADTLYWLHPTVSASAGGGATFRPEGIGIYVHDPMDLFSEPFYDRSGNSRPRNHLVRETRDKLRSTLLSGLEIGFRGSGVKLFKERLSFVAGRKIYVEIITPDQIGKNR